MASDHLLTNVTVTTIKPVDKTNHQETIDPQFFDRLGAELYLPTIYAYRLADNSEQSYASFVDQIKRSLEKVLVPFFPFAGRWIPNQEVGRQLSCNDGGVPFVEAYVDKDLDSVLQASGRFQPVPELNGYEAVGLDSSRAQQQMLPGGMPTIFVQVTRFKCGGVVLGVTFNHMTCDGTSFFDFMQSWSEVARTNSITIKPNCDRSLATTFEAAYEEMDGKNSSSPFLKAISELKGLYGVDSKSKPTSTARLYEVNATAIKALKEEAKSTDGQYISTNDCIVAQRWKLSCSISANLENGLPIEIKDAVDGRERFFEKPMPNLIGNAITSVSLCSPMSASEALSRPLHSVAQDCRRNLLATDWKEHFSLNSLKATASASSDVRTWAHSSWLNFPLYKIDFGVGGTPFFAMGLNLGYDINMVACSYVNPPIPGHSYSAATLIICAHPKTLDTIEAAPGFWSFFSTNDH